MSENGKDSTIHGNKLDEHEKRLNPVTKNIKKLKVKMAHRVPSTTVVLSFLSSGKFEVHPFDRMSSWIAYKL